MVVWLSWAVEAAGWADTGLLQTTSSAALRGGRPGHTSPQLQGTAQHSLNITQAPRIDIWLLLREGDEVEVEDGCSLQYHFHHLRMVLWSDRRK